MIDYGVRVYIYMSVYVFMGWEGVRFRSSVLCYYSFAVGDDVWINGLEEAYGGTLCWVEENVQIKRENISQRERDLTARTIMSSRTSESSSSFWDWMGLSCDARRHHAATSSGRSSDSSQSCVTEPTKEKERTEINQTAGTQTQAMEQS